jgi:membrane protein implicated in regulation of membrane protease activity
MGAYSAVGVLGGAAAVVGLAFGGPVWAVAAMALVVAIGVTLQVRRARRRGPAQT